MISQDKGKTTLDGTPNLVTSELAALLHQGVTTLAEGTNSTYEEVYDRILKSVSIYKLTASGMSVEDAIDILDMKESIVKTEVLEEDGTSYIVKGSKNG